MQKGGEGLSDLASRELGRTARGRESHGAKEKAQQAECHALDHRQRMWQCLIFPPKYDNPNGRTGRRLLNRSTSSILLKGVLGE